MNCTTSETKWYWYSSRARGARTRAAAAGTRPSPSASARRALTLTRAHAVGNWRLGPPRSRPAADSRCRLRRRFADSQPGRALPADERVVHLAASPRCMEAHVHGAQAARPDNPAPGRGSRAVRSRPGAPSRSPGRTPGGGPDGAERRSGELESGPGAWSASGARRERSGAPRSRRGSRRERRSRTGARRERPGAARARPGAPFSSQLTSSLLAHGACDGGAPFRGTLLVLSESKESARRVAVAAPDTAARLQMISTARPPPSMYTVCFRAAA